MAVQYVGHDRVIAHTGANTNCLAVVVRILELMHDALLKGVTLSKR